MDKEIIEILSTLYNIVKSEEKGNTERVGKYFSSKELEKVLKKNAIQFVSNLENEEIDEAIKDFLRETKIKSFVYSDVEAWLKKTDLNKVARITFIRKLRRMI